MKRMGLILAVLVGSTLGVAPMAMADGHHHGGHHGFYGYRGGPYQGYRGNYWAGYRGGYCGGVYRPVYGYPVYPAPGFGVATPNFSLWFGQ
jgi:hypothetical protein